MANLTKCFGYLRCSGAGQITGDTFRRQREKIQKFAKANGFEVCEFFTEEGISGTTSELEDRPALTEMMMKIAANGVRTVLVERADRFSRDLIASELLIKEFQKLDSIVLECEGGNNLSVVDAENPTAVLVRQILGAVAQFDKTSTVLKLRTARKVLRAKNGKCEGRKKFGEEDAREKEIVALIKSLRRKKPKQKRMTYQQIADELIRRKIRTRNGKYSWTPTAVRRILVD
ncbi:recombinase family protein [bacterium]|nr:recombinase family protein [bacterium]MDB4317416.1 recombinase family protein [bacterium]MDB4716070.1 recombinase family protein [bacterium]